MRISADSSPAMHLQSGHAPFRAPGSVLGLALARSLAAADTPGLAATIERFDHLTVGDAVVATNISLSVGHLACTLKSGRVAPVLAGDEAVGLYFEGDGTMEYLSDEPIEAPVFVYSTKKATSLTPQRTPEGIRLRDSFTRLLWVAAGSPLPTLAGASAPSLQAAFRDQREKFGRNYSAPLSHDFALKLGNAGSDPLV